MRWPWNRQPADTDHSATLLALELAQLELDDASVEVDNARDAYAAALATMRDAAGKRARIGRELSRTKEGARIWRIWRNWLRYHHWGRYMHPLMRRRRSGDE